MLAEWLVMVGLIVALLGSFMGGGRNRHDEWVRPGLWMVGAGIALAAFARVFA